MQTINIELVLKRIQKKKKTFETHSKDFIQPNALDN